MTYEFYKQIGLAVAGYVVVVMVVGGVVVWFAHDMTRRVALIHDMRRALLLRSSSSEQGVLLKAQADQASRALPFLESLVPPVDRLINFPRESGALARRQGLEFGFSFGVSAPGAVRAPGTLAFSASGKGAAESWLQFMRAFESGQYLIGLDTVRMTSADGKQYDTTINGKIFTQ